MLTPEMRCGMYRQARAILVRHWYDLGYLNIHLGMNSLTLSGTLRKVAGAKETVQADSLDALLAEMRRIPGVRQVHVDLDNFRPASANPMPPPPASGTGAPAAPGANRPPEGEARGTAG